MCRFCRISSRLAILVAVLALGMVGTITYSLIDLRHELLAQHVDQTEGVTDTAVGILARYYDLAQAGDLSEEEARQAAFTAIGAMHYGTDGSDYVFLLDAAGNFVVHPNADLVGRNMMDRQDPNGVYFAREMLREARNGGGSVAY